VTCICTCCVAEGRRLRRVCVPRDGFCGGLFFAVDGHWCSDYEAAHGGRYILHTTPCVCTFGVSTHWFQRCPVSLRTTRYPRTHTANPRASILYVASEQVWQVALDDLIRILVSTGVWSEYIWDASRLCTTRSPCAPQKPEPQSSANHSMYAYLVAFTRVSSPPKYVVRREYQPQIHVCGFLLCERSRNGPRTRQDIAEIGHSAFEIVVDFRSE
jgi:hypothetical protein